MFKKSTYLGLFCFGLLVLIFLSDGRITASQALKEDISTFSKTVNFEVKTYYPETYFKSELDTTLAIGAHIKITTETDAERSVILTEIKDTINYQKHYRNFIFTVEWGTNPAITFKENFSKKRITELLEKDFLLSSDMVLNAIDINHLNSSSEEIVLNLRYTIPETVYSTEIELSLNESGEFTVQSKL